MKSRLLFVMMLMLSLISFMDVVVEAQEKPNPLYSTSLFNQSAFFRQDVCALQAQFHNKSLQLEDALKGLDLHVFMVESEFFKLNPTTGAIDEVYPGLEVVLLDKLAERAGFRWRNHFTVTGSILDENYTWTELLLWSVNAYDVSIDWWPASIERLSSGVTFPEGWYDASIIMVGMDTNERDEKDEFIFWAWLRPFDNNVWFLIVITLIFSGFVYWVLENIDLNSDKQRLETNIWDNMWLSAISFTSQFEFQPRSNAARVFTLSLAFWAMVMGAAYTANLASFLVVRNKPEANVNSVADAVRMGVPICALRSRTPDLAISKAFPTANMIRKQTPKEVFQAVAERKCTVAVTTVSMWDTFQRDASVNGQCDMAWVGRPFKALSGGFATISDSGTYCTSLITDVLNLHMIRLKEEGFVEEAWEDYLNQRTSIDCSAMSTNGDANDAESYQLNVQNMGGIFVLHGIFSVIAITVALLYKFTGWDKIPRFAKEGPFSRQAVRELLTKSYSSASLYSSNHFPFFRHSHKEGKEKEAPPPLSPEEEALLRAAARKTFRERVVISRRTNSLQRQQGSRHLCDPPASMSEPSRFARASLARVSIARASLFGTQPSNVPSKNNNNNNNNGFANFDEEEEEEPEAGLDPVTGTGNSEDGNDEEDLSLLNELFMNDLYGPAVAMQNSMAMRNSVATRNSVAARKSVRSGRSHYSGDRSNNKRRIRFDNDDEDEPAASSPLLLQLAQRQDQQMRSMQEQITQLAQRQDQQIQSIQQQISQIMQVLMVTKENMDKNNHNNNSENDNNHNHNNSNTNNNTNGNSKNDNNYLSNSESFGEL